MILKKRFKFADKSYTAIINLDWKQFVLGYMHLGMPRFRRHSIYLGFLVIYIERFVYDR